MLLLDEPTAGVDAHSRQHLLRALRSIRARGASIVYSTHHLEEAAQLCDRLMIIDHGRVVAEGTAPELVRRLSSDEGPLREPEEEASASRGRARAHGLEQVLLALTGQPAGDP
ncbi:MAG: hypothetical protein H5U40_18985 [Polyangiaceae bacterium]|nr:hypothetical protein [Polyangiaceae bacterium]